MNDKEERTLRYKCILIAFFFYFTLSYCLQNKIFIYEKKNTYHRRYKINAV